MKDNSIAKEIELATHKHDNIHEQYSTTEKRRFSIPEN